MASSFLPCRIVLLSISTLWAASALSATAAGDPDLTMQVADLKAKVAKLESGVAAFQALVKAQAAQIKGLNTTLKGVYVDEGRFCMGVSCFVALGNSLFVSRKDTNKVIMEWRHSDYYRVLIYVDGASHSNSYGYFYFTADAKFGYYDSKLDNITSEGRFARYCTRDDASPTCFT